LKRFEGTARFTAICFFFLQKRIIKLLKCEGESQKCANWMALGPMRAEDCGLQSHSVGFLGGFSFVLSFAAQKKVQKKNQKV
jgi:hypothetical protein